MKKLFLLVAVFLISFLVKGQVYQLYNQFGGEWKGLSATRALTFPTGCGNPVWVSSVDSLLRRAGQYYDSCNHRMWIYDPKLKAWDSLHLGPAGSGGGGTWGSITGTLTDQTDLYDTLLNRVFISDTAAMLSNYFNDIGYGLLRSGQIARVDSATLANWFLRRKDSTTAGNLNGYLTRTSVKTYAPTLQDVITAGPTLTTSNTILLNGTELNFRGGNTNNRFIIGDAGPVLYGVMNSKGTTHNAEFDFDDSGFFFDTRPNTFGTTNNTQVTIRQDHIQTYTLKSGWDAFWDVQTDGTDEGTFVQSVVYDITSFGGSNTAGTSIYQNGEYIILGTTRKPNDRLTTSPFKGLQIDLDHQLFFDSTLNLTGQDRLLGQVSADGQVGYITLGSGGSIDAGVLNFTGSANTDSLFGKQDNRFAENRYASGQSTKSFTLDSLTNFTANATVDAFGSTFTSFIMADVTIGNQLWTSQLFPGGRVRSGLISTAQTSGRVTMSTFNVAEDSLSAISTDIGLITFDQWLGNYNFTNLKTTVQPRIAMFDNDGNLYSVDTTGLMGGGGGGGGVSDFIFTDGNGFDGTVTTSTSTPTLSLTTRAASFIMVTGTDADITVAAGRAYHLPAATLSTGRNLDMTNVNANGDYVEFYNNEEGFIWTFTGQTVYDSDGATVITELLANTNSVIRRINGKLMISKL